MQSGQDLAHRGDAERGLLLAERLADLVDRIVTLAQRHDVLVHAALLGLGAGPRPRAGEELRELAAKGVAQHAEGSGRIAEAACDLGRGQLFEEEGAQGLVLALARGGWLQEEAAAGC